jgi:hypothetical protein
MNRRDILKNLLAIPLAGKALSILEEKKYTHANYGLTFTLPKRNLPINIDLSMTALQWALEEGRKSNEGKPLFLVVTQELRFIGRQLLDMAEISPEINSLFVVDSPNHPYTWYVAFEKILIGSPGIE